MKNKYETLLHFTTVDALKSIIECKSLRLTSCSDVKNINTESQAWRNLLYQAISENKDIRNKLLTKYKTQYMCEILHKLSKERSNSYIACFVHNRNLSKYQMEMFWEYYGDKSKGVAIEFDREMLCDNESQAIVEGELATEFFLNDMSYKNKVEKTLLNFAAGEPESDWEFFLKQNAYKPELFKWENETRLVIYYPDKITSERTNIIAQGSFGGANLVQKIKETYIERNIFKLDEDAKTITSIKNIYYLDGELEERKVTSIRELIKDYGITLIPLKDRHKIITNN